LVVDALVRLELDDRALARGAGRAADLDRLGKADGQTAVADRPVELDLHDRLYQRAVGTFYQAEAVTDSREVQRRLPDLALAVIDAVGLARRDQNSVLWIGGGCRGRDERGSDNADERRSDERHAARPTDVHRTSSFGIGPFVRGRMPF